MNLKKLLTLAALLLPLTVLCQTGDKTMAVGFSIAPGSSYRFLHTGKSHLESTVISRDMYEVPKMGYTISTNFLYTINNFVRFETGLQFENRGYKTEELKFATTIEPEKVSRYVNTYKRRYLTVPLKANFVYNLGSINILGSTGLAPAILVHDQTVKMNTDWQGNKTKTIKTFTDAHRSFNLNFLIGIGAEYMMDDNLMLRLEPVYSYGLISTTSEGIKENLYSTGVNLGAFYAF